MSMLSIYRASGSASTCAASTSPRCEVQSCQNQSARRRGRFQCNSVYHLTFYGLPPFRTRDACTNYSCHKRTTEPNNTRRNWKQASKLCALPRSQDDATGANIVQELLKMEKEKLQHLDSVQLTQRLERIRELAYTPGLSMHTLLGLISDSQMPDTCST